MFVSIFFCKESINGEVIFVILQIFDVEDDIYSYYTLYMGLANPFKGVDRG